MLRSAQFVRVFTTSFLDSLAGGIWPNKVKGPWVLALL